MLPSSGVEPCSTHRRGSFYMWSMYHLNQNLFTDENTESWLLVPLNQCLVGPRNMHLKKSLKTQIPWHPWGNFENKQKSILKVCFQPKLLKNSEDKATLRIISIQNYKKQYKETVQYEQESVSWFCCIIEILKRKY